MRSPPLHPCLHRILHPSLRPTPRPAHGAPHRVRARALAAWRVWACACAVSVWPAAPALAQTAAAGAGAAAPAATADDTLYQQLGGTPGLTRLVDELMRGLLADARMNRFFKDVDQPHLKEQLVVQLCEVSGGPCRRSGKDMKKAHSGVDITTSDFNAMVEVLQASMDAQGIGFRTQNQLLARLAPMHRDIVNAP